MYTHPSSLSLTRFPDGGWLFVVMISFSLIKTFNFLKLLLENGTLCWSFKDKPKGVVCVCVCMCVWTQCPRCASTSAFPCSLTDRLSWGVNRCKQPGLEQALHKHQPFSAQQLLRFSACVSNIRSGPVYVLDEPHWRDSGLRIHAGYRSPGILGTFSRSEVSWVASLLVNCWVTGRLPLPSHVGFFLIQELKQPHAVRGYSLHSGGFLQLTRVGRKNRGGFVHN